MPFTVLKTKIGRKLIKGNLTKRMLPLELKKKIAT